MGHSNKVQSFTYLNKKKSGKMFTSKLRSHDYNGIWNKVPMLVFLFDRWETSVSFPKHKACVSAHAVSFAEPHPLAHEKTPPPTVCHTGRTQARSETVASWMFLGLHTGLLVAAGCKLEARRERLHLKESKPEIWKIVSEKKIIKVALNIHRFISSVPNTIHKHKKHYQICVRMPDMDKVKHNLSNIN